MQQFNTSHALCLLPILISDFAFTTTIFTSLHETFRKILLFVSINNSVTTNYIADISGENGLNDVDFCCMMHVNGKCYAVCLKPSASVFSSMAIGHWPCLFNIWIKR